MYAYSSDDNAGALHLDNINFTGDCVFSPLSVLINEVAWAGTGIPAPGPPANDEWIELYNPAIYTISLNGWISSKQFCQSHIDVVLTGTIPARRSLREADLLILFSNPAITIDQTFRECISNSGESIYLIDRIVFKWILQICH